MVVREGEGPYGPPRTLHALTLVAGQMLIVFAVAALVFYLGTNHGAPSTQVKPVTTADQLVGSWRPTTILGSAVPASGRQVLHPLTFDSGGQWTGSDGCNALSGTYTVGADGGLSLVQVSAPVVVCAPPPPFDQVLNATSAEVGADRLVLLDDSGTELATFSRASI